MNYPYSGRDRGDDLYWSHHWHRGLPGGPALLLNLLPSKTPHGGRDATCRDRRKDIFDDSGRAVYARVGGFAQISRQLLNQRLTLRPSRRLRLS